MIKKLGLLLGFILVFTSLSVFAQADVQVTLDGKELSFEQQPIVVKDHVLVPLRKIFEALGAQVVWDDGTQTVMAAKDTNMVILQIGNLSMYKNTEKIELDVEPQLVNDFTLVPIRAVAEGFGAKVLWDETENLVTISTQTGDHAVQAQTLNSEQNDEALFTASVTYPVFANPDNNPVLTALNQSFVDDAKKYLKETEDASLSAAKEEKENAAKEGYEFHPYTFTKDYEITYDKNSVLSILWLSYQYTGGAHPTTSRNAQTIDLKTGNALALTDILNGTQEEINAKIIEAYEKAIAANPDYFFEDASKTISENIDKVEFYLNDKGIVFYFQLYEIAPYAAGYQEASIDYSETALFKLAL